MEPTIETRGSRHAGPSLPIVAAVSFALFAASLVTVAVLTGGGHIPSPFGPLAESATFFADHAAAVQIGAALAFGAAIPLGIYTASVTSRLAFLGLRVAGVNIALFGGLVASALLALSGLIMWVLGQPTVAGGAAVPALHLLAFATGGPGHVVALGLLVAGVAVSGGLTRLLSRPMMVTGVAIAAIAELSALTLVIPAAAYLLPLARLTAMIWIIVAGVRLPASRKKEST